MASKEMYTALEELFAENEKHYSSLISSKMPIILSNLEKEWLIDMLQDSNISSFISEALICMSSPKCWCKFAFGPEASYAA